MSKVQKKWNRVIAFCISIVFIFTSFIPAKAQETVTISKENQKILLEGTNYGIFDSAWQKEASFQKKITKKRLKTILTNTEQKLESLGLEKKKSAKQIQIPQNVKRESVLTEFYKILKNFKLPDSINLSKDAIDFFIKQEYISSNPTQQRLDTNCTLEQACVWAAQLIEDIADLAGLGAKGLFWKAVNGKNTVYMLGSIHMADSSIYPFDKQLKEAFDQSEALYVEADITDSDGMFYMASKMIYSDGSSLKDVLTKEEYEKVEQAWKECNMPLKVLSMYKPWAVASVFNNFLSVQTEDMDTVQKASNSGIDYYFINRAQLNNIPLKELEGIKFQTDLFDSLSMEYQQEYVLAMAEAVLNGDKTSSESLQFMLELWKKQDYDSFGLIYSAEQEEDEFSKKLLGERDANMAKKIGKLLDKSGEHTYFVVVGAAHLATEGMVITRLQEAGYKVEKIK